MGVLGLTPFLAKHCPDVLKELPNGIKAISGKTVVIDATLLTQRFHFGGGVHNRHVSGWYRFITNLRASNVNAICVFDGKERNLAKARELQRRRETRATSVARENLEVERLDRLAGLQKLVRKVRALSEKQRGVIADELRPFVKVEIPPPSPISPPFAEEGDQDAALEEVPDIIHEDPVGELAETPPASPILPPVVEEGDQDVVVEEKAADITHEDSAVELGETPPTSPILPPVAEEGGQDSALEEQAPDIIHEVPVVELGEALSSLKVSESEGVPVTVESPSSIPETVPDQVSEPKEVPVKKLAAKLIDSYKRYSDSLPNFAKLQIAVSTIPLTSSSTPTPEQVDPDPDFHAAASRHQYQLALQEGQAWSKLVGEQSNAVQNAEDEFQDLQERSRILTDNYQKRNEFPTAQTYEDAKSLLVAMGVPCVQSEAPYEGEGLAAAIVLAGHADFVVSEDTDVIIYGAPLLRNMTDRKKPMMEIDSREVRKALSLPLEPFIDFALLLGTDFTPRLKNVGPVRALKFIREHGSIEEIVKTEKKYPPQFDLPEYLAQVELGREIFRSLPPVPSPDKLQQLPSDDAGIQAVVEGFGLSAEMLAEEEDFFTVALKGNYFGDNPHQD